MSELQRRLSRLLRRRHRHAWVVLGYTGSGACVLTCECGEQAVT